MRTSPICPYCSATAALVDGSAIYPHRPDLHDGKYWHCSPCRAWVGVHKNSRDHKPLGRLANPELRRLKMDAHAAFDPVWKSGRMSRRDAYASLAGFLGIEVKRCHIGMMDEEMCSRVVLACRSLPFMV